MINVIDILSDIIKIDTTNLPGNEKEITNYIKERYKGYKNIIELDHGDNRISLIVDIEGRTKDRVGLIGHIDTVPVTNEKDWKYPPFSAHIEDGEIYGRGSSDMKSGIACMIALGEYYIKREEKPNKNIRLVFTADEESNGLGIRRVLEEGFIDGLDFLLVPENTSSMIGIKEKGALWLEVEVFGKSAHGARPDLGINSIDLLYEIYEELKIYLSQYPKDEYLGYSTVSLNSIKGGGKVNIIADYCVGEFDIRYNPDLNNKDIIKKLEYIMARKREEYRGVEIKFKINTDRLSFQTDMDDKFVLEFIEKLDKLNMNKTRTGITYFTDLSLTHPKIEKPFLIYGPGYIDKGHQQDESAPIDEIEKISKFFIEYFK